MAAIAITLILLFLSINVVHADDATVVANSSQTGHETKVIQIGAKAPFTHFCKKKNLRTEGKKVYCNWFINFAQACNHERESHLEKGSFISPIQDGGKCDDGDKIVKVKHN